MTAGELYDPADPELVRARAETARWLVRLAACAAEPDMRRALLAERLAELGEGAEIRDPFRCDYGFNIRVGARAFLNFGCVILDVAPVTIGEGAQIGPNVMLCAADHPREAATRRAGLEFGRPVVVGPHAWIGAGAIVLPGVTIGEGAVVGAGAVATRDVPAGATVAGNPARLLRR
ncbi:MAG: sugar O-acetyltransferase [Rhizobiales bacterium]|nr:sugar O-acetyltransferase [Hyphomicrobiales bacterium]